MFLFNVNICKWNNYQLSMLEIKQSNIFVFLNLLPDDLYLFYFIC